MADEVDLSYSPEHEPNTITDRMIVALEQTRPHTRIVSTIGFVMSLLMAVLAAISMFVGAYVEGVSQEGAGFRALMYLVMSSVYFVPALLLSQFCTQIGKIRESSDRVPAMEAALDLQRSFWRFVSILALISIVVILIAVIIGVLMLMSAR